MIVAAEASSAEEKRRSFAAEEVGDVTATLLSTVPPTRGVLAPTVTV